MKRFLSGSLVMFGMVSLPAVVSPHQPWKAPVHDYRHDPRFTALHEFFVRDACPAADYTHVFLNAADTFSLDWRLLPSLSYIESTGGKAAPHNNLFGWDEGRAAFPSPEAAIFLVGYRLSHSSLYRAKSLDQILRTYNTDPLYARQVKAVMAKLSSVTSLERVLVH
jgi:hypothetical protein